ncbi:MAG: hypothetical protein QOC87_918 [Actinomycetota bacterium]|jgi:hypothetical protein|nr:hypothetical protein [Actinomycetota bacterium]
MRRAGIVVGVVLMIGAISQVSALAGPAGTTNLTIPTNWMMGPERSGCSFDIQVAGLDQVSIQTTYDKTGAPVKVVEHIDYTGTQTANGTTLKVSEHAVATGDLVAGTETWTGQQLKISLPKGGNVSLDVGKVVTDDHGNVLVQHGWHPAPTDTTQYCAAFGS